MLQIEMKEITLSHEGMHCLDDTANISKYSITWPVSFSIVIQALCLFYNMICLFELSAQYAIYSSFYKKK